jgi:hypothetical protein
MKLVPWSAPPKHAPPLSPPMTAPESVWWNEARKPLRRRVMIQWGVSQFLAYVTGYAFQNPAKFFEPHSLLLVPLLGLVAFGGSFMFWRSIEDRQRQQEIRWKRIRESLLEEPSVAEAER